MKKFSDIPGFIIEEYYNTISDSTSDDPITYEKSVNDITFTDRDDVEFIDHRNIVWNIKYTIGNKYSQNNSYLIGSQFNIVSYGGNKSLVYAETETDWKNFNIIPSTENFKETEYDWVGTYYNFKIADNIYPEYSEDIKYELEGTYYKFIQYDSFSEKLYKTISTNSGYNIYFRSDDPFIKWAKTYYSEYINLNKDYIFIGNVFPYLGEEWRCRIFVYLMKDFVIDSLPTNNRPQNLVKFFQVAFDKIYSTIYNQQKEIKTIYDPQEIKINLLRELSSDMGLDLDINILSQLNEENLREFVSNIPILIKKKGTISSLFSIWNLVTQQFTDSTSRSINLYEYWHDTLPDGEYLVKNDDWKEINYLNKYQDVDFTGCSGDSYYSRYTKTYPDFYQTNIYQSNVSSYIHKQYELSSTWEVNHFINETELVIQCYNDVYEEFIPSSVDIKNNATVIINFNKPTIGYCVVQKAGYGRIEEGTYWNIQHYINSKLILTQSFNVFNERFMPSVVYLKDHDTGIIQTTSKGYGYFLEGDYIYYDLTSEEDNRRIWTINHGLYSLLIVQVYDINDNMMFPKSIKHNQLMSTEIEFSKPVNGYAILKEVGSVYRNIEGNILSPHYKVECDLTCRPINNEDIINEETVNFLINNFESMRGVTRVPHYHFVFAPLTDFSGSILGTYEQKYISYWLSSCIVGRILGDNVYHHQVEESTTWDVQHNFKTKNVLVYAYNSNYEQVYYSWIEHIDYSNLKVHFDTPQSGYLIVIESEKTGNIFTDPMTIEHDYQREINYQFFNLSREETIFPESIINNPNSLELGKSEEGYYQLTEGNIIWTQTNPSSTWDIQHNLNTTGIVVQFYDGDWERIFPSTLTLNTQNDCVSTFSESVSGYCVIKSIGFINYRNDIKRQIDDNGVVVVLGDGNDKFYILDNINDVQNPIDIINVGSENIYIENDNLYIDIELDESKEYDIQEIGIFDTNKEMLYFYSQGSIIHKKENTTMTLHYRVSNQDL